MMSDRKGDPLKKPPECGIRDGRGASWDCPHLKEVGGGFEGERYKCEVCGEYFYLDYEEMK